jgi:transmembrane sensor
MTNPRQNVNCAGAVKDIIARAAVWRERRDGDDWTDADQVELDAWLSESMGHRVEYWRLDATWNRADRLGALRVPNARAAGSSFKSTALKCASVLFCATVLGVAWSVYSRNSNEKVFSTPVGGRETLALADGSEIELNTDTVLRTTIDANHRSVELEKGEVYFKIKHDSAHPFVVTVANHRIVDLGTKFAVRSDGERVEVALVEGRARFESTSSQIQHHSAVLMPGDVVVATARSMTEVKKSTGQLLNELGWRNGIIVLHRTALADAVAQFNRYNERKLIIATPSLRSVKVGGTFPITDVDAFTRVAKQVFGLKVEQKNGEILISR